MTDRDDTDTPEPGCTCEDPETGRGFEDCPVHDPDVPAVPAGGQLDADDHLLRRADGTDEKSIAWGSWAAHAKLIHELAAEVRRLRTELAGARWRGDFLAGQVAGLDRKLDEAEARESVPAAGRTTGFIPVLVQDSDGYIYDIADRKPIEGDELLYILTDDAGDPPEHPAVPAADLRERVRRAVAGELVCNCPAHPTTGKRPPNKDGSHVTDCPTLDIDNVTDAVLAVLPRGSRAEEET